MSRWYALWVSLAVVSATLYPARQFWADSPKDSFPLSWYPMFHRPRGEFERHPYVVGIDSVGETSILRGKYWDPGGMNQQREHLAGVVRQGPQAAQRACERVAAKVARRGLDVEAVEIRIGDFSLEAWFAEGQREPARSATVVRCPVVRA